MKTARDDPDFETKFATLRRRGTLSGILFVVVGAGFAISGQLPQPSAALSRQLPVAEPMATGDQLTATSPIQLAATTTWTALFVDLSLRWFDREVPMLATCRHFATGA